jgi:citrate lyase beta subunit
VSRTHERQPLQTLYVPADRVTRSTTSEFGAEALRLLEAHAPDADAFVDAFGIGEDVAEQTRERTLARLERQPVEDLRVDFEDGYGVRAEDEEDRHAAEAAAAVREAVAGSWVVTRTPPDEPRPSWFGLRVKSFDEEGLETRSVRTLELFTSTIVGDAGGIRDGFLITFPKVSTPTQVQRFAKALGDLETRLSLPERSLRFEVQIETPRSVIGSDGAAAAPRILEAGDGRITAMHLGVFDYTASLGLMPWEQRLDHPANDFARQVLQVALAGTGVWISDGSSNVVPANDETPVVRSAWRTHADHVRHSLANGFYQGWDLHPAHLASRYAAVYGWLLERFGGASERVAAWREGERTKGVLDEPATISSLLRYLRFAISSGAVEESVVLSETGLGRDEFGLDG